MQLETKGILQLDCMSTFNGIFNTFSSACLISLVPWVFIAKYSRMLILIGIPRLEHDGEESAVSPQVLLRGHSISQAFYPYKRSEIAISYVRS